jgi:hypothetical protein
MNDRRRPQGTLGGPHDQLPERLAQTREQTISQVRRHGPPAGAEFTGSRDASSRRGLNRTLVKTFLTWGAIGALAGAGAGLLLPRIPGAGAVALPGSLGDSIAGLALGGAIFASVLAVFIALAREDGRVADQVLDDAERGRHRGDGDAAAADRAENEGYPLGRPGGRRRGGRPGRERGLPAGTAGGRRLSRLAGRVRDALDKLRVGDVGV